MQKGYIFIYLYIKLSLFIIKKFSSNIINNDSEYRVSLKNQIKSGIHFIKVNTENGAIVKKVFINI